MSNRKFLSSFVCKTAAKNNNQAIVDKNLTRIMVTLEIKVTLRYFGYTALSISTCKIKALSVLISSIGMSLNS